MAQGKLQLSVIGQIAFPLTDLDRSVTFYRDTLGMKFLFQVPNLAFFDCAGVRLMLDTPQDGSGERGSSVIYFQVDDIQVATKACCRQASLAKEHRISSPKCPTTNCGWPSCAIPTKISSH